MVIISKGGLLVEPMRERELVLVHHAEPDDSDRFENIADEEVLSIVGAGIMKSTGKRRGMDILGLRQSHEAAEPRFFRDVDSFGVVDTSIDRMYGRTDVPLSARGARQAAALAASFDGRPPMVVLTSPRRHAAETSDTIARRFGIEASIDVRLDDVDYGAWTGLDRVARRQRWTELYEEYLRAPQDMVFPGGEAVIVAQARAWQLIGELFGRDGLGRIVLVTHDAILRMILCSVLGTPLSKMHEMQLEFASATALRVRGNAIVVAWRSSPTDAGGAR